MGFDQFLIEKGVHVIPDWAQQWQEAATSAVPGFEQKSVSVKQELLYQELLRSNLHLIGRQALPIDLQVCWSCPPSICNCTRSTQSPLQKCNMLYVFCF